MRELKDSARLSLHLCSVLFICLVTLRAQTSQPSPRPKTVPPAESNTAGNRSTKPPGSSDPIKPKPRFQEVPGTYYSQNPTTNASDPCNVRDLVERMKQLQENDSAAANTELERLVSIMKARMQACLNAGSQSPSSREHRQYQSESGRGPYQGSTPDRINPVPPPKLLDPSSFDQTENNQSDKGIQEVLDDIEKTGPSDPAFAATKVPQDVASNDHDQKDLTMNPDCQALGRNRDSLITQFDHAIDEYSISMEGANLQMKIAKDTLNLMNDEWWAGQDGAEVAIEIKRATDHVKSWLEPLVEEEWKPVKFTETLLGRIKDNNELVEKEVNEGAQAAAKLAFKQAVKEALDGIPYVGGSVVAEWERRERVEGMEQFKRDVQSHVGKLVDAAKSYAEKAKASKASADYIEQIKEQIDQVCGNPVIINQHKD